MKGPPPPVKGFTPGDGGEWYTCNHCGASRPAERLGRHGWKCRDCGNSRKATP